jgi:hypothetical protein
MPEATVNENDLFSGREHKVRPTGQALVVQKVAVAKAMQEAADDQFRRSVLRADAGHQLATRLRGQAVHVKKI